MEVLEDMEGLGNAFIYVKSFCALMEGVEGGEERLSSVAWEVLKSKGKGGDEEIGREIEYEGERDIPEQETELGAEDRDGGGMEEVEDGGRGQGDCNTIQEGKRAREGEEGGAREGMDGNPFLTNEEKNRFSTNLPLEEGEAEGFISLILDDEDKKSETVKGTLGEEVGEGRDGGGGEGAAGEGVEKLRVGQRTVGDGEKENGALGLEVGGGTIPSWIRGSSRGLPRSPLLRLHQEIVEFCSLLAPTDEEREMRAAAVGRVQGVVKSIWSSSQVHVFGSYATGLYLPSSDIDMVVLGSEVVSPQRALKALAKALVNRGIARNLQVIGQARVPIVKFVEKESAVAFDISFNVANGPDAAEVIKEAMKKMPPLRPLCLVLKLFLQQRRLNEVYSGGIGSYALLVMIMAHLQMHPSRRSNSADLEPNLGVLLVDFLDLYGREMNTRDVGISARDGGVFFPKRSRGMMDLTRIYLLAVEDPQFGGNDLGRSSYNIANVRAAFSRAHHLLTSVSPEASSSSVGFLGRILRIDPSLSKRTASWKGHLFLADAPNEHKRAGEREERPEKKAKRGEQERASNGPLVPSEDADFPRGGRDGGGEWRRQWEKRREEYGEDLDWLGKRRRGGGDVDEDRSWDEEDENSKRRKKRRRGEDRERRKNKEHSRSKRH